MDTVSGKSTCIPCKKKYNSPSDTRWVSCCHIFCTSRLTSDYDKNELRCLNCGYFHNPIVFDHMPERQHQVSNSLSLSISGDLNNSLSSKEYRCHACDKRCSPMTNSCLPWMGCLEVFCVSCLRENCDKTKTLSCLHCGIFYETLIADTSESEQKPEISVPDLNSLNQRSSSQTTRNIYSDVSGDSGPDIDTSPNGRSSSPAPLTLSKDAYKMLPICDAGSEESDESDGTLTLVCDLAGCYNCRLVGFCVQCEHKLCLAHQQTHLAHYGDQHDMVSIERYKQFPGRYTKPRCKYHKNEVLVKACKECDKLICNRCDLYTEDCSDHQSCNQHNFRNLEELNDEIRSHYEALLTKAEHRIREMQQLEREACTKLSLERKYCKDKLIEIERFCNEQIRQIFNQCKKAKENVRFYQNEVANEVAAYTSRLVANRENLEHLYTRVQKLMTDHHIAERIRCKQDTTGSLTENIMVAIEQLELETRKTLIMRASPLHLNISLVRIPARLRLVAVYYIGSKRCLSVSHSEDGHLMAGTEQGLKLFNKNGTNVTNHEIFGNAMVSATVCNRKVYARGGEGYVYELSADTKSMQSLFKISGRSLSISVSDRYAASLIQADTSERADLVLYNFHTKQSQVWRLSISFQRICFLPDGHLLATYDKDKIGKFYLEDGKLTEVWTCTGVDTECCMRVNPDGLIYVFCFKRQTIYIISSINGEILKELFSDMLPAHMLGSVSLEGDELAVPGWMEGKVYLFSLK